MLRRLRACLCSLSEVAPPTFGVSAKNDRRSFFALDVAIEVLVLACLLICWSTNLNQSLGQDPSMQLIDWEQGEEMNGQGDEWSGEKGEGG